MPAEGRRATKAAGGGAGGACQPHGSVPGPPGLAAGGGMGGMPHRHGHRRRRPQTVQMRWQGAADAACGDVWSMETHPIPTPRMLACGSSIDPGPRAAHTMRAVRCWFPQVRNKNLSKRETEKLVKEVWKERTSDPRERAGGRGRGAHDQMGIAPAVHGEHGTAWYQRQVGGSRECRHRPGAALNPSP